MAKPSKKVFDILIIEDEIEIAQIIEKYLKLYPPFRRVVIAQSTFEAKQKLSNQVFDLIVMDIQLKRDTSLRFIESMTMQPKYHKVQYLVVSGCVTRTIALQLMRFGIRHVIVKPFTVREILENAISCLKIDRRPEKIVNEIIAQISKRLIENKEKLDDSIADDKLRNMIESAKENGK